MSHNAENGPHRPHPPTWWQRVVLRRTARCSCGWSGHTFDVHRWGGEELARLSRPPHVMIRHGRVALHASDCWCRAERGPNDRQWVAEHLDECAECRGDEQHAAPTVTCDDLGCVNGMTVQGRKYDYDGTHEDQWAPCGRCADTCPIPPATSGESA